MSREPVWPWSMLVLTWLVSSALYTTVTTVVFHSFVVTAFDNAVIEQVVARLSHFSAPITEVEGVGVNYFGDHFSPVLALYAPFYRLVPAPETLFAVQGAVLGLSVVVVLVTASRILGRRTGLAVTVLYALSFGLIHGVVLGARETPFAVLLLALAGACHVTGSTRGVVLASLGLLLVKEDLGLTVAAIGAVMVLDRRTRKTGVALSVGGLVAFALIVGVVIPGFAAGNPSPYASSTGSMLDAATSGWVGKAFTIFVTFGVAGLVSVRHRWSWVTVPTFAWRFTAPKMAYWTPLWHYSAPLMPVVFVALVQVLRHGSPARHRRALAVGAATTALMLSWFAVVPVALVVDAYASDRPAEARRALAHVPAGASVVADEYLVNHLGTERRVYYVPTFSGCPRPAYVVGRVGEPEKHIWGGPVRTSVFLTTTQLRDFASRTYGGAYQVVDEEGAYVVLSRQAAGERPCVAARPDVPTDH